MKESEGSADVGLAGEYRKEEKISIDLFKINLFLTLIVKWSFG